MLRFSFSLRVLYCHGSRNVFSIIQRHIGDDEQLNWERKREQEYGATFSVHQNLPTSCCWLLFPSYSSGPNLSHYFLAFDAVKSLFRLKFNVLYKGNFHHVFHLRFISWFFFPRALGEQEKGRFLTWALYHVYACVKQSIRQAITLQVDSLSVVVILINAKKPSNMITSHHFFPSQKRIFFRPYLACSINDVSWFEYTIQSFFKWIIIFFLSFFSDFNVLER